MTSEHLDVRTALRFADGNIEGVRAFREMMCESAVASRDPAAEILKIISDAVVTVQDSSSGTAQKSAAVKLLELVAKSLELQAGSSNHLAWLDATQREAEHCRQVVIRLEQSRARHKARERARFQTFMATVTTH